MSSVRSVRPIVHTAASLLAAEQAARDPPSVPPPQPSNTDRHHATHQHHSSRPCFRKDSSPVNGPTDRAVYTVPEVADLLCLSRGSTYAMLRTGQIPALRLGSRWVIPKRRFHSWLDDQPTGGDL